MQYQYLSEKEKNELASGLAGDGVIAEEGKISADPDEVRSYIRLKSSTASSTKIFKVTVDDTGELTATEET